MRFCSNAGDLGHKAATIFKLKKLRTPPSAVTKSLKWKSYGKTPKTVCAQEHRAVPKYAERTKIPFQGRSDDVTAVAVTQ